MSKVKDEPRIKNPLIAAVREQLEQRAAWLYLLCDEAGKKGLAAKDFAPAAIRRCGIGEAYGCRLELTKTIANGDDICHLLYHK